MAKNICEICDYEDTSKALSVVQVDIDGIKRCTVCRHKIRYGRYIRDDDEEIEMMKAGNFTDEWKEILFKFGETFTPGPAAFRYLS